MTTHNVLEIIWKFRFCCTVKFTSCSILVRNAAGAEFHSATKLNFSNYLKNIMSGHKVLLAWTNLSKMLLFPWLHHGNVIFNFEKSIFFHCDVIFDPVQGLWAACLGAIFCINKVCEFSCKNQKSYQKFKVMLQSCQKTPKLFFRNHIFGRKESQKSLKHVHNLPTG